MEITPKSILKYILDMPWEISFDRVFVITGKSGPTGKTWLWNKLREYGFDSIELSEWISPYVEYIDDENHYIELGTSNAALIVLNKPFY